MVMKIEQKSFLNKMLILFEKNQRKISTVLMALVIAFWVSASIIPNIVSFNMGLAFTTSVLTLLVMIMLEHVSSIKKQNNEGISIFTNTTEFNEKVTEILDIRIPKKVDLIEYSTATIREDWLLKLIEQKAKNIGYITQVRLLICHPDNAISEVQRGDRICVAIRQLYHKTKDVDISGLRVKCYDIPASLRGRNFDDQFVAVGWYTYRYDMDHTTRIRGDGNVMIGASTSIEEGIKIHDFFKKCFDGEMWPAAKQLKEVCGHFEFCKTCPDKPTIDWLKAASQ